MKTFTKIYFVFLSLLLIFNYFLSKNYNNTQPILTTYVDSTSTTSFPSPTLKPIPIPTKTPKIPTPTIDSTPWGVAQQIGEHTWTMKINLDPVMATPSEILNALNEYRHRYGSQPLSLDSKLVAYAQTRVDYFNQIKNIDSQVGFNNFLEKEDGFNKLGFTYLGENISYGYRLSGVHLIEWVYAGDEPHNKNQLDTKWDHVGIAVKGTATCLIFATGKF